MTTAVSWLDINQETSDIRGHSHSWQFINQLLVHSFRQSQRCFGNRNCVFIWRHFKIFQHSSPSTWKQRPTIKRNAGETNDFWSSYCSLYGSLLKMMYRPHRYHHVARWRCRTYNKFIFPLIYALLLFDLFPCVLLCSIVVLKRGRSQSLLKRSLISSSSGVWVESLRPFQTRYEWHMEKFSSWRDKLSPDDDRNQKTPDVGHLTWVTQRHSEPWFPLT